MCVGVWVCVCAAVCVSAVPRAASDCGTCDHAAVVRLEYVDMVLIHAPYKGFGEPVSVGAERQMFARKGTCLGHGGSGRTQGKGSVLPTTPLYGQRIGSGGCPYFRTSCEPPSRARLHVAGRLIRGSCSLASRRLRNATANGAPVRLCVCHVRTCCVCVGFDPARAASPAVLQHLLIGRAATAQYSNCSSGPAGAAARQATWAGRLRAASSLCLSLSTVPTAFRFHLPAVP